MEKCEIVEEHTNVIERTKSDMLTKDSLKLVSEFFKTIGDITRMKIIWALDKNELCVCDLCNIIEMSQSAISHQLAILKKINMVKFQKVGKEVFYSLSDYHVKELIDSTVNHVKENK